MLPCQFSLILVPSRTSGAQTRRGRPCRTPPILAVKRPRLVADLGDVLRRWSLLALDDVELHLFPFGQRLEAAALDGGVMHEAVLLAIRWGDEAKALRVVEPFHG